MKDKQGIKTYFFRDESFVTYEEYHRLEMQNERMREGLLMAINILEEELPRTANRLRTYLEGG